MEGTLPQVSLVPQTLTVKKTNWAKNTVILLIPFLLISLVGNLYFIYKLSLLPFLKPEKSNFVILPADPSNSQIIDYGLSYYLDTEILGIKKVSAGLELETPIAIKGLPRPVVSRQATVFKRVNRQLIPMTHEDIKVGQKVGLHFYHDMFKFWEVSKVIIITE